MKSILEVMEEMKGGQAAKLVKNWKTMIPPKSRWSPGDPGDPSCEICEGTGYLRMNLPVGHPNFGKLFLCECVKFRSISND